MRAAVVGAGPAGLAALRALRKEGLDAVAFERGRRIGGVWTLEDRPTAAYRSLHLITSRERTEFAELPMSEGTPDYPSRDAVGRYLEDYAARFELNDHIRLGAEAVRAERREGGGWEIELGTGERESADVLVAANGHNEVPAWPDPPYPGEFAGRQLHALDYADADDFRGARVLVVGMGNSAMDIATDLSHVAERTLLSVRRGSWVMPSGRFADGSVEPVDAIVWCTGYRVEMPFLDRGLVGEDVRRLALFKRVLHLDADDLFFVGLMQSTGSAFPILERQSPDSCRAPLGTVVAARSGRHGARLPPRPAAGGTALGRARPAGDARGLRPVHARVRARVGARPRACGGSRLSGRALVTGASGAFGTALRHELRSRGWRVAGLDLRPDPADDEVLECDITGDDASVRAGVDAALERHQDGRQYRHGDSNCSPPDWAFRL